MKVLRNHIQTADLVTIKGKLIRYGRMQKTLIQLRYMTRREKKLLGIKLSQEMDSGIWDMYQGKIFGYS